MGHNIKNIYKYKLLLKGVIRWVCILWLVLTIKSQLIKKRNEILIKKFNFISKFRLTDKHNNLDSYNTCALLA